MKRQENAGMERKVILLAILVMQAFTSILVLPSKTWVYPDSTSDHKWEAFGPRADRLLIKMYANDTEEFAALEVGDIDIIDWPIPKEYYEKWTTPPYNETIKVVNYGAEFGLFILDMNSNGNADLGNPPDPDYPNPVGDQDDALGNPLIKGGDTKANNFNPMSNVTFRRAISYLIDRPGLIADPTIGAGFGFPMYTTIPPAMSKYVLDVVGDPTIPWAWQYDPVAAAALLDASGFPINTDTGYRYWDRNNNGVEDPDEYIELIFYIRNDHPGRNHIGTVLVAEMSAIGIRVNAQYGTSYLAFVNVMVNKDFHLYTGGWSLGMDPDHLVLWKWDYYWHPGFCYNYGGHDDAEFNDAANSIIYVNTQEEAVFWAYKAQYRQAYMVLSSPLYAVSGNKAYRRTYTGPETPYNGKPWQGIVNILSDGIDNAATFSNMHPEGYAYDHGDPANPMTIRWGMKVPELKQLNPVFASWLYDWNVLGLIYGGTLFARNASDLGQFIPNIAKSWEVETYIHPIYGERSKIRFSMRTDVSWSDGYALTVADIYFTYVELWQILERRGIPPPWWYSSVEGILSFDILDPYNFVVLLDVKSYWALSWIGLNIILPKHIWKPIAETGDPQAFAPDPNLIGNGPWRLVEYVENSHVLLVANRPGRTVTINLPGSEPITAVDGYYGNWPLYIDVHPLIKFENMTNVPVPLTWPEANESQWHQIKGPEISTQWKLVGASRTELMGQGTWIDMLNLNESRVDGYHIFNVEELYGSGQPNRTYIKVDWWTAKIPVYGTEPPYTTPVELGVTIQNLIWATENKTQPGPSIVLNKYVYLDGELIEVIDPLIIPEYPAHHKEEFNLVLPKCKHVFKIAVHIKDPGHDSWTYITNRWVNYTFPFWVTPREDIIGGTLDYHGDNPVHPVSQQQILTPDCEVNIRDVSKAARAFGTYPGHARWDTASDIIEDYEINIRDIAAIAKKFGWA